MTQLKPEYYLEGGAAVLAEKMISEDEFTSFNNAFNKLEKEEHNETSNDADREFHSIIANATHNTVLADQIYSLLNLQKNIAHVKEAHNPVC